MENNGFTFNGQNLNTVLVPRSFFNQGTLWAWGYNNYFGLGDSTTISRSSPVQTTSAGINWKQIVTANSFGAGVKDDGTLWTWGRNNSGQLGDNSTINKSSPVQTVSSGTNWKSISAGWNASQNPATPNGTCVAIKTDGSLWAWGRNSYGQIGDNTTVNKSSPVQTTAGTISWVKASIQLGHTTAIKSDGTLWTWGLNNNGQLGNNSTTNVSSPIQTVASGTTWNSVSAGAYNTAATKTDGTLWVWGKNNQGQLGDNTTTNASSPIQTVASGTNWSQVAIGGANFNGSVGPSFMVAVKTNGTLWTWGGNAYGQLGDNTTTAQSSPVQTISSGTNWKSVSAGYAFAMAIKTDGTLWSWGWNSTANMGGTGQLGDGTTISRSSPVQTIASGTNWSTCSSGYGISAATTYVYNPY